jgi:hypothetical protein
MAIQLFSNVTRFLSEPLVKPTNPAQAGINLIKITGRTTALAAMSSIIPAIMRKYSKQEGPLPGIASQLLKASLLTGATSAAIAVCYLYIGIKSNKDYQKAHRITFHFEKLIIYTGSIGMLSTLLAFAIFRRNETFLSIYRYSRLPLIVYTTTAIGISFFHQHQMKKL